MEGDLSLFQTIVIAIVEGLTEFLPVSSTGHMIITQHILGVESTDFVKAFTFIIRFCQGFYIYYPVWCNPVGGMFILEKLFPSQPYSHARKLHSSEAFPSQI